MTLKELKSSLSRFSGDFDDSEVFISFKDSDGKENYDMLAATGHDKNLEFICLITLGIVNKHLDNPVNKRFKKDNNNES